MNWSGFIAEWKAAALERGFEVEVMLEREGLQILACTKGKVKEAGHPVYLSSGVHGDEPAGPLALLRLLQEGFFDESRAWQICPCLNPTGLQRGTRETKDGVDLNRDYLRKEAPEVQAHVRWLERQAQARIFISLHEDWESTGFYYYEIRCGEEGPRYEEIITAAAPFFPPEPQEVIDDHKTTRKGWIYHKDQPDLEDSWPEAIYLARRNCSLSLTFETPSSMDLEDRIGCQMAVVRKAVESLGR